MEGHANELAETVGRTVDYTDRVYWSGLILFVWFDVKEYLAYTLFLN